MNENIVLIGMPGAGKSTVGVVLAKIMNRDFVDVDLLIQRKHGKTLQQLIDERGALGFIALEGEALSAIQARGAIVSTGGSAVYSGPAMESLRRTGPVVYLRISLESLEERLGDLRERGVVLLEEGDASLQALYAERAPLYLGCADIVVDVEGLSITDAALAVRGAIDDWRGARE